MYIGHLIVTTADWLQFALSRKGRVALCVAPELPETNTGDPIFILSRENAEFSISLHTTVSFRAKTTAAQAVVNWGNPLGARDEAELNRLHRLSPNAPAISHTSPVDVLALLNGIPIFPTLSLRSLKVEMPIGGHYKLCDENEVLRILEALPEASQTSWTRRVVERRNDIGKFSG
jgi:hypothetical protein